MKTEIATTAIATATAKIMAGDATPATLRQLEEALMQGTPQEAAQAASIFQVWGGVNSPPTPPHRQAALVVACKVETELRAKRAPALAKSSLVGDANSPSRRRVMPQVVDGEGRAAEVLVKWTKKNERLREYPAGGGSLPACNGKGTIVTPTGEFLFEVSIRGTSDGYQYLSDADAWAACPAARASVGHP